MRSTKQVQPRTLVHRTTTTRSSKHSHKLAESESKMENFKTAFARAEWVIYFVAFHYWSLCRCSWSITSSPACRCCQIIFIPLKADKARLSTYGGGREMSRRCTYAHVDVMDSGTVYIIRYANRAQDGGVRLYIRRVYKSINQSGFPAEFCNISTWKASSGQNLKTNFTKTRWCCKTARGLLPLMRRSQDSEILSYGLLSWRLSRNGK